MIAPRHLPTILRQVWRHRTRSGLTIAGIVVAMFLFVGVQSMQAAVESATTTRRGDVTLIVYRENRFCPATSRLPEWYGDRIARIPGVASVTPMKVVVNNCGASLDVITFRGIPADRFQHEARAWTIVDGTIPDLARRSDAAVIGESLARRRGLKVGEAFDGAGVRITIAAIIRSDRSQDENVAYVGLPFLQRAADKGRLGIVTQFNVTIHDPARLEETAKAIDAEFASEREPTHTRPERAFLAQAGADIVEIVGFTRYLGWGCLAAVLALIANSIILSVQDRIREHGILQTLGYRPGLIARLIIAEGLILSLIGGLAGAALAWLVLVRGNFALFSEGLNMSIKPDPRTFALAIAIAGVVGIIAGLVPALRAARREIASCFRAV